MALTLSVLTAAICVSCIAEDGTASRDSLVQAVAEAQKHFDSLSSKESSEAIDAMRAVIACKRELLLHLVHQDKDDTESIQREVRSLFLSTAWVANVREKKQEFAKGQFEWIGFTDSCRPALGIECPE